MTQAQPPRPGFGSHAPSVQILSIGTPVAQAGDCLLPCRRTLVLPLGIPPGRRVAFDPAVSVPFAGGAFRRCRRSGITTRGNVRPDPIGRYGEQFCDVVDVKAPLNEEQLNHRQRGVLRGGSKYTACDHTYPVGTLGADLRGNRTYFEFSIDIPG